MVEFTTSSNKTVRCKYCDFQFEIPTNTILIQCTKCSEYIAFFNNGTIAGIFH